MEPQLAIPWYRSNVIMGIAVSLVCKALILGGLVDNISGDAQEQLASTLVALVGGTGDLWAIVARLRQTTPAKVVGTKATAEVHNSVMQQAVEQHVPEQWQPAATQLIDDAADKLEVPSWMLRL